MPAAAPRIAVVGAGWAGLACAVGATRAGAQVTLYESARSAGGRARSVPTDDWLLDNGQHILIGAYTETLGLMRIVGADPDALLMRLPLSLRFADGGGLALPRGAASLALLRGIAQARGWSWRDKLTLLRTALAWRLRGFRCDSALTVAGLCEGLPARVMQDLIDPLCVSALNTPTTRASAAVFLRVLRDALLGPVGASDLLLPRADLDALFPRPALDWLAQRGATLRRGQRVQSLVKTGTAWQIDDQPFDRIVLACPPGEAARLAESIAPAWARLARSLRHEPIATVYAMADRAVDQPMLALRCNASQPAQFVFDRGQLGGQSGLLAFVASAWHGERAALEAGVVAQARVQLGLKVRPVSTLIDKRATFACTPGLQRPPASAGHGLLACGDYIEGPYPATLEGAVRSGLEAAGAALRT
ncbi:hydroxysqualene dehydroxylase HpnE [Xylophilus sp. GOD-11R]|uniref:hydroxysqualene dehydroxylase HpnE n=1 Tax=Xylophilus sp. GOD-11R TaxID=3089814 RepID=UPI00298C9B37|nr:hydroxysqualene dehydroxylase HpnE [Xylophilus sp. GOD-11R]WPB58527.1 hydroxysqualene dehydroxylase HpnE [Xylophilus sp. GOD-11R]